MDEKFPGLLDQIVRAAKQEFLPVASA
jgi:hypothetical protein